MMFFVVSLVIFLYVIYRLYQHFFPSPNINPTGKYVLISGCDTGFGHLLAIDLDKQGFHVFAGVYISDNVELLQNQLSSKSTVVHLDITKQNDIDHIYELIKKKTNTLHALVNNAGIARIGVIDVITMEAIRETMEVNFFGHVAMTKKFLPLLITQRHSRVVYVSSVAGIAALPSLSAYNASKYAIESFADTLRREMFSWKLDVSVIEPAYMKTPIIHSYYKTFDECWLSYPEDARERWGRNYLQEKYQQSSDDILFKHAEDPMKVVRALRHAVMNTKPRIRYNPGWQATFIFYPFSLLPAWLLDLIIMKLDQHITLPTSVHNQPKD